MHASMCMRVVPSNYIRSMSEIRKANVEGATYFVTFTVHGWVDVFTRKELADDPPRTRSRIPPLALARLFAE